MTYISVRIRAVIGGRPEGGVVVLGEVVLQVLKGELSLLKKYFVSNGINNVSKEFTFFFGASPGKT